MKRSPLKRQSSKGAAKEKLLAQIKREKLQEQIDRDGYCHCEWPGCHRNYPQEDARFALDLDHIRKRSLCGDDSHENTRLICILHNRFERP